MKPQKTRDVVRLLREQGWRPVRRGAGSHEIWSSPTGQRMPIPTGSRHISAGVLNTIEKAGAILPKEWK